LAEYLFGGQNAEALVAARAWLAERRDWPGEAVLDILLARLSPRLAVEKSPENAAGDEALARLADAYPEARYIHLTREPAATQRSMQAHWERVMPGHPLEGQPMLGFAAWVDVNRRILGFTERLPRGRVLRLRAEDILDGNPGRLRAVASWLGLSRAPTALAAMSHPETSPFACPGPKDSGIIGGFDPGFLEAPVMRKLPPPPTLRLPEGWSGHEALWQMVEDLAERLGYAG
ncbi:MAG TPA: sulfotransferase, partial [Dongiaceae bacterium]